MISRMCVASLLLVFCLASPLVAGGAVGHFGGFAGRSYSVSPGFHSLPQPHGFSQIAPLEHQRQFRLGSRLRAPGFALPLVAPGGVIVTSPYYAPVDHGEPTQPSYVEPEIITSAVPRFVYPIPPIRRGCDTQVVTVPSESGEKRTINVVRC
jgi:hypothetical protein